MNSISPSHEKFFPKEDCHIRDYICNAARFSSENNIYSAYVLSTANAIKGLVLCFFQSFVYSSKALTHFFIAAIHLDFHSAQKAFRENMAKSTQCIFLSAAGVFFVAGGIFFPHLVYLFIAPFVDNPPPLPVEARLNPKETDQEPAPENSAGIDQNEQENILDQPVQAGQNADSILQPEITSLISSNDVPSEVSIENNQTIAQNINPFRDAEKLLRLKIEQIQSEIKILQQSLALLELEEIEIENSYQNKIPRNVLKLFISIEDLCKEIVEKSSPSIDFQRLNSSFLFRKIKIDAKPFGRIISLGKAKFSTYQNFNLNCKQDREKLIQIIRENSLVADERLLNESFYTRPSFDLNIEEANPQLLNCLQKAKKIQLALSYKNFLIHLKKEANNIHNKKEVNTTQKNKFFSKLRSETKHLQATLKTKKKKPTLVRKNSSIRKNLTPFDERKPISLTIKYKGQHEIWIRIGSDTEFRTFDLENEKDRNTLLDILQLKFKYSDYIEKNLERKKKSVEEIINRMMQNKETKNKRHLTAG